jgi:hypothetical protein
MMRFCKYLAVAALAVALGASSQTRADFTIRATEVSSGGVVEKSDLQTKTSNPAGFFNYSSTILPDFTVTLVTHITTTGAGFSSASTTININYTGPTGANSDKLIIEVLSNNFSNPTAPATSVITSNGSPSTSGLLANSLVMTSGVVANGATLGAAGTTLGGQLGMTTGTGSIGSASSLLSPNPVTGATFSIANPFSFYQTYTFSGFGNSGQAGSLSAGSTVAAVPAPAGLVLALAGLPVFGLGWLRRRKANVTA